MKWWCSWCGVGVSVAVANKSKISRRISWYTQRSKSIHPTQFRHTYADSHTVTRHRAQLVTVHSFGNGRNASANAFNRITQLFDSQNIQMWYNYVEHCPRTAKENPHRNTAKSSNCHSERIKCARVADWSEYSESFNTSLHISARWTHHFCSLGDGKNTSEIPTASSVALTARMDNTLGANWKWVIFILFSLIKYRRCETGLIDASANMRCVCFFGSVLT